MDYERVYHLWMAALALASVVLIYVIARRVGQRSPALFIPVFGLAAAEVTWAFTRSNVSLWQLVGLTLLAWIGAAAVAFGGWRMITRLRTRNIEQHD
jgi:hypothetical protein